ncbi:hypothetical protein DSO57_1006202 [Entomophthora muscae]|uniref:Uncharacterized protein n=1 Tax=Entomophthora muscae TaxID=34485 RepID=A0ACC2S9S3_9FUNG|nr:hypothetical protein DSO57_1006202 [Entomophthora muscae]
MGLNAYFPQLSPVPSFWSPRRAAIPVLHWAASWWFILPGWEPNLVSLAPLSHTHTHGPFNEEGGMPLVQSPATASPYHQAAAFTAANAHAGKRAGAPYGLPNLSQFMPEHQRPQAIVFGQPLLQQAPAPLEMDANSSPSKDAIHKSIHAMDAGGAGNGSCSEHLAIQQPSAENSLGCFQNLSHVNPNQLCCDLRTVKHIKNYLQQFTHPAICHNQMHLGRIQSLVYDQGILIYNQQTLLQVLYSELGNTFTTVNQYLAKVTNVQNTLLHWVNAI